MAERVAAAGSSGNRRVFCTGRAAVLFAFLFGILVVVMSGASAPAQVLDYGSLLGTSEPDPPQQSRPVAPPTTEPMTSRPRLAPGLTPSPADYGLIAESVPDPTLNATRQAVNVFRGRLVASISRLPEAWKQIDTALAAASPTGKPSYFLGVAIFAVLLLMIGRAVSILYAVYIARPIFVGMQKPNPIGYIDKLPLLVYRTLFTAFGVVLNVGIAAMVGLIFYQEHEATLITVILVFASYGAISLVDVIWRMALAPYLAEYRLPKMDDHDATVLYRWLSLVSIFGILSMAFSYWMQALGLSPEVHMAITILLSLIIVVSLLVLIRVNRRTIDGVLLDGTPREEASWLARTAVALWAPVLFVYLVFTWGDLSFRLVMGIEGGPLRLTVPYLIFLAGILVYAVTSYVIERVFARTRRIAEVNRQLDEQRRIEEEVEAAERLADLKTYDGSSADVDGDGEEEAGPPAPPPEEPPKHVPVRSTSSMHTMEDLARRVASLFAIGAVSYSLIKFWGGADVFERYWQLDLLQNIIDLVFVGYVVFHAVRIWIDRKIEEEGGDDLPAGPMEGEGGGAGATRLATLLPLFRNFLLIIIATTVILLAAMELGVNVAPLFAGAGIVGLAIGFGAQTLVRDILSGAFFLMDDAFRKGEYIDVGEVKGTVEKISLRSFQLRHHLGMLHTIPFGEITHLTNFSRDWVMMKLPLRVTYDTDVERVRKLIKKLGIRLLDDPEIGDRFIQPLKSQGVIMMEDSAMIIRVKFMTKPGEQWVLRKRIYNEIRELFAAEGIKFAHREVTVRIPGIEDKKAEDLTDNEIRAVGAAARRVGDQVEEEMLATGTGGVGDTR